MAQKKKKKGKGAADQGESFADKRTANPSHGQGDTEHDVGPGNAQQQKDEKGRLGGYGGTGEHPRTGNPGRE